MITEKRHSLAHLLGDAIVKLKPSALLTIGPAVEHGFYYDVDLQGETLSLDDLPALTEIMKTTISTWSSFIKNTISEDEAKKLFAVNPYKLELISEISTKGEEITTYTSGEFTDLCRGGHVENMNEIEEGSWKLEKLSGAYWRGDQASTMLTRVYGIAFDTKDELTQYLYQIEEGLKRDHRKLGKELDLFTISELVGSGLPLFKPNGVIIRRELENFLWELHKKKGYQRVWTPHIAKEALYKTSGHSSHYMDDMFKVHGGTSKEDFYLKPMSCPHHMQIFADTPWSYRDMPVRYFEPATIYRDEKTGQLSGLTRVRSITQDDGHLFVPVDLLKQEIGTVVEIIKKFYTTVGMIHNYRVRLSLRGENKDDYLGGDEVWDKAEGALTELCKEQKLPYFEGPGEAAFYGPKLDFMFKDAIGREHQLATVQVDFNLPERFDLSFVNKEGQKERPVVIHRAVSGSLERFIGVMIEHFGGSFPVWMSPNQVTVIPVLEKHEAFAKDIQDKLDDVNIRAKVMMQESLGKRIRGWKVSKEPYAIVIGDKEMESGILTIEGRNDVKFEMSLEDFTQKVLTEIKERSLDAS